MELNDKVWVYSFGHWYAGTIAKTSPKRVWVQYTTGTDTTRVKPYSRGDARVVERQAPYLAPTHNPHQRQEASCS